MNRVSVLRWITIWGLFGSGQVGEAAQCMTWKDFSMYDVITFDCYGTLVDWEGGIIGRPRSVVGGTPPLARCVAELSDLENPAAKGGGAKNVLAFFLCVSEALCLMSM